MNFLHGTSLTLITLIVLRLSITLGNGDGWGKWSDYTVCSKTCGNGVQHSTRYCLTESSGSSRCHGHEIQYQSCNVQECPSGAIDFRSYQCNAHNVPSHVPNGANLSSWRSHFDPDVPCALMCKNEIEGIKKLQEVVIDGTECDNGDSFGICINGICKPVGCDHLLGAVKIEDKCLVCGGNGETCQTVLGSTKDHIKLDKETQIATIPNGATNVNITMMSLSPIKLELKSQDGTSLILSEALNAFRGKKHEEYAGTYFNYKGMKKGIKIAARGPLNKTLQLIVGKMVRLNRHTPLIEFEYSTAKLKIVKRSPHRYYWVFGSWTSCSQKCGIGYQLRAVSCIDHETGKVVSPHICPQNEIPVKNQTCNEGMCHISSNFKYKWVAGHWGECSVDCGLGEQTQIMHCIQTDVTGNSNYTSDDVCLQYMGVKPVLWRACYGEAEYCPYWATGSWSECSVTCGVGSQSRSIYCQRDPTDTAKDPVVLKDSFCPNEKKPPEMQSCHQYNCINTNNNLLQEVIKPVTDCKNSMYGCCPDNITYAKGSYYFGCSDHVITRDICEMPSNSGSCSNYSVKWYFDTKEKACLRFWYGGCNGNDNRFDDIDSCRTHCIQKSSCKQSKDIGTCTNYTLHWYFESASRVCRQFWFGGCGGNSNKYFSKEDCEAKCINAEEQVPYTKPFKPVSDCDKSQYGCCPNQHTPAKGPNYFGCQKKCEDTTYGCCTNGPTPAEGPNQEGCDLGSGDLPCDYTQYGCCPDGITVASGPLSRGCGDTIDSEDRIIEISSRSNTEKALITEKCTAPVSRDLCTEYSVKWRFDNGKQECVRHWWGGCKDNGNVFASQGDCEAECKNTVVIMSSVTKNPEKCTAPVLRDLCTEYSVKWRFENGKQECVRHWWGGCQDNGNIFESQEHCETECMNTVVIINPENEDLDFINICDMPKDVGPCTDRFLRYFYDPKDRECRVFYYGGCQGNENNFVKMEDCQKECMGVVVKQDTLTTSRPPEHETFKFPAGYDSYTTSRTELVIEGQCHYSNYGCCEDGVTAAENFLKSNCKDTKFQPGTIGDYKTILVTPGMDAFLRCTLRGREVLWYRDSFYLASNQKFQIYNNGTLILKEVTEDMSGIYSCRVSNGNIIPLLEKFKVQINIPLSILPGPTLISTKPGDNAIFHCQAVGSPLPQISWIRNGNVLQSSNHYNVFDNGTLIISSVHIEDAGEYECSAENGIAATVRRITNLNIEETIGADIQSHQGIFIEGETIHLLCKGTGYPEPQLEWMKEGNVLKSDGKVTVRNGELIIRAASIEDAGMYKCIASNERDKMEDVTTVQITFHNPQTKCEDTMRRTKCSLIVAGRLCGFRIFGNKCCQSCRRAGHLQ